MIFQKNEFPHCLVWSALSLKKQEPYTSTMMSQITFSQLYDTVLGHNYEAEQYFQSLFAGCQSTEYFDLHDPVAFDYEDDINAVFYDGESYVPLNNVRTAQEWQDQYGFELEHHMIKVVIPTRDDDHEVWAIVRKTPIIQLGDDFPHWVEFWGATQSGDPLPDEIARCFQMRNQRHSELNIIWCRDEETARLHMPVMPVP